MLRSEIEVEGRKLVRKPYVFDEKIANGAYEIVTSSYQKWIDAYHQLVTVQGLEDL